MAGVKKFEGSGSAKTFERVGKASSEKASVIVLRYIHTDNLLNHPDNGEDITRTTDLETSIKDVGFIDPIEVTELGAEKGKFVIVSGRRRRAAGVSVGMTTFPCLVRAFENSAAVSRYILFANNTRDSDSDPLLLARRYKLHEALLRSEGVSVGIRKAIADRMGLSPQQADRYDAMNRVIESVWDMVSNGEVGLSSVVPLAVHTPEEQAEIFVMMRECEESGARLTREAVRLIVDAFKEGAKSYEEARSWGVSSQGEDGLKDSGIPLNATMDTEPGESQGSSRGVTRSSGANRGAVPVAANNSEANADIEEQGQNEESGSDITDARTANKPPLTDDEKAAAANGRNIFRHLAGLNSCLKDLYSFADEEEAQSAMVTIADVISISIDEMSSMSKDYNKGEVFKELIKRLQDAVSGW